MKLDGARVMIVEDEPIVGIALEDMLTDLGAGEILFAERLEDAEAFLNGLPIDFAVLDVNVHGRPSYPIAERLAKLGVPFIFATGYGDSGHPDPFGTSITVAKPYGQVEIATSLALALRQARQDRAQADN